LRDLVETRRQTFENLDQLAALNENEAGGAVEKAKINKREGLERIGEALAGAFGAFGYTGELAVRFRKERNNLIGFAERPGTKNDSRSRQGSGHRYLKVFNTFRQTTQFFLKIGVFLVFSA
jgi:hypothetical protein